MKINFVVVDSGPIIKGAILENFCKHAISVPGVIKEIKDVKTRERFRNLPPYFFSIRSPSEQAIKHVTNVSKTTGDFKVLSKVDIEVLALAYEMENMKNDNELEQMFEKLQLDSDLESNDSDDEVKVNNNHFARDSDSESIDSVEVTDSENSEVEDNEELKDNVTDSQETTDNHNNDFELVDDKLEETTYMTSLNDDDGWVTPENIHKIESDMFGLQNDCETRVAIEEFTETPNVGCLTTDYAMQNVLLHMKIHIVSINGMIVKEPRIFVSYCRSCFRKYRKTDIYFCPWCGNDFIGKVPAKIKENGEMELFFKKNFQPNLRHKIFSIPTPKGGKHTDGNTYIYCADQRLPQERAKKSKFNFDIYEDGNIPFMTNDVSSRSSALGITRDKHQNLRPTRPKGNKRSKKRC